MEYAFIRKLVEDSNPILDDKYEHRLYLKLITQMVMLQSVPPEVIIGIMATSFDSPQQAADFLTHSIKQLDLVSYSPKFDRVNSYLSLDTDELTAITLLKNTATLTKPIILNYSDNFHKNKNFNPKFLELINNQALQHNPVECPLPSREGGEGMLAFKKRLKAFKQFQMQIASLPDKSITYLTHSYDKRGRVYCNGYLINYQGADQQKASVELNRKEQLLCK